MSLLSEGISKIGLIGVYCLICISYIVTNLKAKINFPSKKREVTVTYS